MMPNLSLCEFRQRECIKGSSNYFPESECLPDSEYLPENGMNYDPNAKELKRSRKTKRLCLKRTYGLRPRNQMRRPSYETEGVSEEADTEAVAKKREPRSKIKNSLSSGFRRLTANARERQRMKEINTAFNTLQSILPTLNCRPKPSTVASKSSMTKIRTLRQAASYIKALSELLSSEKDSQNSSLHFTESETYHHSDNIHLNVCVTASYELHSSSSIPLTTSITSEVNTEPTFCISYQQAATQNPSTASSYTSDAAEELPNNDDELFSLLEKEVLSIRNGEMFSENCTYVGDLNWMMN